MLFASGEKTRLNLLRTLTACAMALGLGGCFDSGFANSPAPIHTTVGGTVAGLNGTVTLALGQERQQLSKNGSFTFEQRLTEGQTYSVTVVSQPDRQTCVVTNG